MKSTTLRAEVVITIGSAESLILARQRGREFAVEAGLPRSRATMVAAAISELARNIIQYAGHGEILLRRGHDDMLHVVARDNGAGIVDTRRALEPGYSTSAGLGLGLPGVKRIADEFEITSGPGGTTVTLAMKLGVREPLIEIGRAQLSFPGETESGDRCVVKPAGSRALIAAIDGVGHGHEAALAAAAAADVLERHPDESLDSLMLRCHERLRETRGAAITLTHFDTSCGLLKWVGAGTVRGMLLHWEPSGFRQMRELTVADGVAGIDLPSTDVSSMELARGDVVVLTTYGLPKIFLGGVDRLARPQALAQRLLTDYSTAQDDALVVVARVGGASA